MDMLKNTRFEQALESLEQLSASLEQNQEWPDKQLQELGDAGVLGWVIPPEWGGFGVSDAELMRGYQRLASACLVTTFVLTQRNGACQRIAGATNSELKAELLPPLARGEIFATVGISHLTTSRQHIRKPAVQASHSNGRIVLDGEVPWVTGAKYADYIVTGGTCEDSKQVLVAVPTKVTGLSVAEPAKMLALNASQTGAVHLDNVELDHRMLIAGPIENVMKQGQGGGAGSLTTSALAIGAASRCIDRIKEESGRRPDLVEFHDSLADDLQLLVDDLGISSGAESETTQQSATAEDIRQRANSLVLRASQAYLAASKGAGFVDGHPAGRAIREAMFFLVWSCPQPVLDAALRELACSISN